MNMNDLVQHAAFELVGMHPDDQGAALAAAAETLAAELRERRPWLSDAQIIRACTALDRRVRARLRELEGQAPARSVH